MHYVISFSRDVFNENFEIMGMSDRDSLNTFISINYLQIFPADFILP